MLCYKLKDVYGDFIVNILSFRLNRVTICGFQREASPRIGDTCTRYLAVNCFRHIQVTFMHAEGDCMKSTV